MPYMWHQDVQNRKGLRRISNYMKSWIFVQDEYPAFLLPLHILDSVLNCILQPYPNNSSNYTIEKGLTASEQRF
jgi:hypothetical protein